jgi:hypothetical protein
MKRRTFLVGAAGGLGFAMAGGCAPAASGNKLSGEVVFKGAGVPFGDIVFSPDGAKGASGPQGKADIRDGKYSTGEFGVAGGAMIVRVTGFDKNPAEGGKLLFEHEYSADVPAGGTFKIEIPEDAGKNVSNNPPI